MIEAILNIFPDQVSSQIKKAWDKIRYFWFKLFTKKTPYSENEAIQLAYGGLSGHIDKAISFRNIDEKRPYILTKVRASANDHDYKFILLKAFSNTFIKYWEFKPILLITDFEIVDIQKKGFHDFVFIERSAGSGADTTILNVVDLKNKEHIKITEHQDWTTSKNPKSPDISIEPDNIDNYKLINIEKYASYKGFFEQNIVDLSKPEHAIQNWHRLNGEISKGEVKLHFYSGRPNFSASISEKLVFEDLEWIAYFKGPLYGYIKNENQHFIAYSPSWTYNWPKNLTGTETKVTFERHSEGDKLTFEYNGQFGILS